MENVAWQSGTVHGRRNNNATATSGAGVGRTTKALSYITLKHSFSFIVGNLELLLRAWGIVNRFTNST